MNSKAFICYANQFTEVECLDTLIFGFRSVIHYMGDTERLETYGFLFNYEADELVGPFIANSQMNIAIDPNAFQGRYPFQVRVKNVGTLMRKKDALNYMKMLGIQTYKTQTGRVLPSHQISLNKAEKIIQWLNNENNISEATAGFDMDIFGELIENSIHETSKIALLDIKKAVTNKKRLPYEIADKLLIRLREEIVKPEIPFYEDKIGLLRKSLKSIFLDKKVINHQQFKEICSLRSIQFDPSQEIFLPIVFEITKKL